MKKDLGKHPFLYLNKHRKNYYGKLNKMLEPSNEKHEGYILEKVFFSPQNIDLIQKQLIMNIFNESKKKYLIPYQNKDSILIVMKYIFNFYAQHLPFKIKDQVTELNNK